MTPTERAITITAAFIVKHPELKKQATDAYDLFHDECEEGASVENELSLLEGCLNDLVSG